MDPLDEEQSGGAGWIVSFADLMTLLFAFFVVLWGLKSEGETVTILGAVSSIRESFVKVTDHIPIEEKVGPLKDGRFDFSEMKGNVLKNPSIKKHIRAPVVTNVINSEKQQLDKQVRDIPSEEDLGRKPIVNAEISSYIKDRDKKPLQNLVSFLYAPGRDRLTRGERVKLMDIGKNFRDRGVEVVVIGHTDNREAQNHSALKLSAMRAARVADILIQDIGIPSDLVVVEAFGDAQPLHNNQLEEGRKLNRRIELRVRYMP